MESNVFKFLWGYTSKIKVLFFITGLSLLLGEVLFRATFYFSGKIVDLLSSDFDKAEILTKVMFFVILASCSTLIKGMLYNLCVFLEGKFVPLFRSIISRDLFSYAHKHSTSFFAEEMAGNVSGKISNIIEHSSRMYYIVIWGFLTPIFGLLTSFFFMFEINVIMSLVLICLNLFFIFLLYIVAQKIAPYSEKRAKMFSEVNGVLVDSITNASLVKSFSNFLFEKRHYFKSVKKAALADRKETYKYAILFVYISFLRTVIEVVFYIIPIYFWYKGQISVGEFVFTQSMIFTISGLYTRIMQTFLDAFKSVGTIRDGLKLLGRPYEIVNSISAKPLNEKCGDIVFDDMKYHYKGANALFENFNLIVKQGTKVGLVGHSGSGKSTLVKLLSRYYDIQSGEIRIGKQNIANVRLDSLRKNIALIPQDPSLFNRTIMENIRYGRLNATDEEVFEAAKKAFCHDFIFALPEGYYSKVGERGVMLSGGERQRIAIARAILKNAPILILDEATSALDSESEKYIQESLKFLMKGKTVITIAHRLSTLREMDNIVVLDKGLIVETGNHQSLLRRKGIYYNFYSMQSSGFIKNN